MSELRATTISDTAGTGPVTLTGQWAAKAGFLYDQANVTVTDSENISSITDDALGKFAASFTNSFANSTYREATSCGTESGSLSPGILGSDDATAARAAGEMHFIMNNTAGGEQDREHNSAALFGDLA